MEPDSLESSKIPERLSVDQPHHGRYNRQPSPFIISPERFPMTEALSAPKFPTAGFAPGFAQANLVVTPHAWAYEFLLFYQRNPKPCPLLEVTDMGNWEPIASAPGADLRQDLPYYHDVYQNGELIERRRNILNL